MARLRGCRRIVEQVGDMSAVVAQLSHCLIVGLSHGCELPAMVA